MMVPSDAIATALGPALWEALTDEDRDELLRRLVYQAELVATLRLLPLAEEQPLLPPCLEPAQ